MDDLLAGASLPSTKRALLVLSHAMERAFDAVDSTEPGDDAGAGLVIALFQRREYFDREAARYEALAAAGHTVLVGFTGPTDGIPPGVTAVSFADGDLRAQDWILVLVRGTYATSLVARDSRDLSGEEATLEAGRLFSARWTFRREVALVAAREQLDRLAADLAPSALAAAMGHMERSAALPLSRVETRLATAADHLVASVDLGQRRAMQLRLALDTSQSLAVHDQLTGLKNRHYLDYFLGGDDKPAELYVLLVDVDDLKTVNDTYGHEAGDAVLRTVAAALRTHSRPSDVVIRWGGDEFLLLLPEAGSAGGLAVGQRLADAVRATSPSAPWGHLTLSVSIGMCSTRRTTLPLEQLDAALYGVKRAGKGFAAVADTPESAPVLHDATIGSGDDAALASR